MSMICLKNFGISPIGTTSLLDVTRTSFATLRPARCDGKEEQSLEQFLKSTKALGKLGGSPSKERLSTAVPKHKIPQETPSRRRNGLSSMPTSPRAATWWLVVVVVVVSCK